LSIGQGCDQMEYILRNGIKLSRDVGGEWQVAGVSQSFYLKEAEDFWRVVSLLEMPYEKARSILGDGFAYPNVILAGLDSKSEYWIGLALSWVGQGGFHTNRAVIIKLRELIEADQFSQADRSSAQSFISRSTI